MKQNDEEQWNCESWSAIHDHRPGSGTKGTRVQGTCMFPTSCWEACLEVGNGGINPDPDTLYLELKVTQPTGPVIQVNTPVQVQFEDKTNNEYTTVLVNHGHTATITVEHPR